MAVRTIIFRGKRIDNGEWLISGTLLQNSDDERFCWMPVYGDKFGTAEDDKGNILRMEYGTLYRVDPETVSQYTGKVVKTGKVFDGDIGKSIDGIFLVCWDDEKAAFVMRFNEYPYETLYLEEMWDDAEIIGNIHDNPELLEVR